MHCFYDILFAQNISKGECLCIVLMIMIMIYCSSNRLIQKLLGITRARPARRASLAELCFYKTPTNYEKY